MSITATIPEAGPLDGLIAAFDAERKRIEADAATRTTPAEDWQQAVLRGRYLDRLAKADAIRDEEAQAAWDDYDRARRALTVPPLTGSG